MLHAKRDVLNWKCGPIAQYEYIGSLSIVYYNTSHSHCNEEFMVFHIFEI